MDKLEQEILSQFGKKRKGDIIFTNDAQTYNALYIHRGRVCCLHPDGMDYYFEGISEADKISIHKDIMAGNYKK